MVLAGDAAKDGEGDGDRAPYEQNHHDGPERQRRRRLQNPTASLIQTISLPFSER